MRDRLDLVLVRRGLARSRSQAADLIRRGQVRVNGVPATRASQPVAAADHVEVPEPPRYASRAGDKLAAALDHCGWQVTGCHCLDLGASTGGFTDCLLQRGAASVLAVDVGHNQLAPFLKSDPRVRSWEGVHALDLAGRVGKERFDWVTVDVSFISLVKVLPAVVDLVRPGGRLMALVKPQFELQPSDIGKGGVVRDETSRLRALQKVVSCVEAMPGWKGVGSMECPLPGGDGNREYFLWAVRSETSLSS